MARDMWVCIEVEKSISIVEIGDAHGPFDSWEIADDWLLRRDKTFIIRKLETPSFD
jgi:hypothetical protein